MDDPFIGDNITWNIKLGSYYIGRITGYSYDVKARAA